MILGGDLEDSRHWRRMLIDCVTDQLGDLTHQLWCYDTEDSFINFNFINIYIKYQLISRGRAPAKKVEQIGNKWFCVFGLHICRSSCIAQKSPSFFVSGLLEGVKSIWIWGFFYFFSSIAKILASPGILAIDKKQYNISNSNCFKRFPGAPNRKNKVIFGIFSQFCIREAQKTKMDLVDFRWRFTNTIVNKI